MRLQKYLAESGVGSRRHCEELIGSGQVQVNGAPAHIGQSVVPGQDRVTFRGRAVRPGKERVVIALYKPAGYLSTCFRGKEEGWLVKELVDVPFRLFPVGRLDRESEGLLLLTNDGELALHLTHPRYGKEKEYEVELDREPDARTLAALAQGVRLDDGPARAASVRMVAQTRVRMVLHEGRKREVRRMLGALGYEVRRLCRVRIGSLSLGDLKPGEWRRLSDEEADRLVGAERGEGKGTREEGAEGHGAADRTPRRDAGPETPRPSQEPRRRQP
ncbi:MAG: pseudouridine synthase [bacterium]